MASNTQDPATRRDDRWRERSGISHAIALGTNLAAGMGVFVALGYYVDRKRGGGQAWTLCGMCLGLLYGAYEVWKVIRELSSQEADGTHSRSEKDGAPKDAGGHEDSAGARGAASPTDAK